jgi:hypothetical protein
MTLKRSNQLVDNNMEVYTDIDDYPINEDQYNLFTLRADLHLNFNQGAFVFVPKSGQLRIHFLKRVRQSGIFYHDTLFNHHDRLSQLAKEHVRTPRAFDFFPLRMTMRTMEVEVGNQYARSRRQAIRRRCRPGGPHARRREVVPTWNRK